MSRVAPVAGYAEVFPLTCRFSGRQDSTTRPLLPATFVTTSLSTVPAGHGIMRWKPLRERPYPVKLYRAGHCLRNARANAPVFPCVPAGLPHYDTMIRARLISLRSITRSTLASRPRAGLLTRFSKSGVPAISCRPPFPGRPNFCWIASDLIGVEGNIAVPSAPLQPHQRHYAHAAIAVSSHWHREGGPSGPKSPVKRGWQPPVSRFSVAGVHPGVGSTRGLQYIATGS